MLEPVWSCGPTLPPFLIDFLEKTVEEDEVGSEIGYDELLDSD